MPRVSDSRAKMVRAAAKLFRRQGYAATGWRQVIAESRTPWGSQAHHFPGGKVQLATEALDLAGREYEALLRHVLTTSGPAEAVRQWMGAAAHQLKLSGWADGCPVATVALESAADSEVLAAACDSAFSSWRVALSESLAAAGINDPTESLALTILAGIEGGLLLARAARDENVLRRVGDELADLIQAKMPQPTAR
ncbi:MAG: TetR family transcriptional regulator [Mycobacterium sp.]|nr:TetR family transcriptional regulator [Mycobacterium sp.]